MARDRESEDKMSDTENKPQSETETPEDGDRELRDRCRQRQ